MLWYSNRPGRRRARRRPVRVSKRIGSSFIDAPRRSCGAEEGEEMLERLVNRRRPGAATTRGGGNVLRVVTE